MPRMLSFLFASNPTMSKPSTPTSLAGYQLVCDSTTKAEDLVVPCFAVNHTEWAFIDPAFVNLQTDSNGAILGGTFRIYRKSSVPHPGDTEKVPGTNITYGEQRANTPPPPHHSVKGCGSIADATIPVEGTRVAAWPRPFSALPKTAPERKATPVFSGVMKYFPRALCEVARVSKAGNDQHHPGTPLHWDMSKSTDELDALVRHLLEAGTIDTDGQRHSAKVAWRALANLERELLAAEGSVNAK